MQNPITLMKKQAWSHRQWIINTINHPSIWEDEIEYTNHLIAQDIRNNSAWNQRWFATHYGKKRPMSVEKAKNEVEYAIKITSEDPYNESPLRYLVALVREQHKLNKQYNDKNDNDGVDDGNSISASSEFISFTSHVENELQQLKETLGCGNDCPTLISALIDILEMKGNSDSKVQAADMANELAFKFDLVRKKYWLMREGKLRSIHSL